MSTNDVNGSSRPQEESHDTANTQTNGGPTAGESSTRANAGEKSPTNESRHGADTKTKADDTDSPPGDDDVGDEDGPQRHRSDLLKEKIKSKTQPEGGFDPTPVPDFPPGYTIKIVFHKATNLPAADIHNASSDPYLLATLTAAVPKRHKEDPLLQYRSRTIRHSTEPEWEEAWTVANVPGSGFRLKCRLYDEDWPDHDDRLGNVTYTVDHIDENWEGIDHKVFDAKKRVASKRAYVLTAAAKIVSRNVSMTPHMEMSIKVLGKSEPPGAQMHTLGQTRWIKHYSPMIGRLTGIKVNKDKENDHTEAKEGDGKGTKKYE
jgi:hypothetical protein